MGEPRVAPQVGHQAADRRPAGRGQAEQAGLAVELLEDGPDRPVPAPRAGHDGGQVLAAEAVYVGGRQGVDIDARAEVGDGPQEGQQQADLGSGVQARAPREAPRQAGQVEAAQDGVRLRVRPDEHGVIAWGSAGSDPPGDVAGHPVGFVRTGREGLVADGRGTPAGGRFGPLRAEPLVDPRPDLEPLRVVESDEPMAGGQDARPGSIVPPQDDVAWRGPTISEVEQVAHRRAPEAVDRLVVVAHDGQVAPGPGDQLDQLGLRPVGVLELVDEDVPEAVADLRPGGRRLAQEAQCESHLVAEVDEALGREEGLVAGVGPGQLESPGGRLDRRVGQFAGVVGGAVLGRQLGEQVRLADLAIGVGQVGRRVDVLVLEPTEMGRQGGQEAGRVGQRAIALELELEQPLAQEDDHLRAGQDADVGRQAELQGVLADEPIPEGMERGDGGVGVAVRDQLVDPDLHLRRRLVGEGQGEDLRRPGPPGGDQPGDPTGHHLGLAGARPGDHEERTLAVGHRPALLGVEPAEQGIEAARRGRPVDGSRAPVRGVRPDRDLLERPGRPPPGGPAHRRAAARSSRGGPDGRGHGRRMASGRDSLPVTTGRSAPADPGGRAIGQGDPARGRTPGERQRLRLLVRQGRLGSSRRDGLGVDPGPAAGMEAADHDAIVIGVEQGQGESSGCCPCPRTG